MRIKLSVLLLLCYTAINAQPFKYPVLNPQGKSIKSLIPAQWKVIDSVYGDLNQDKTADLALVMEFYAAVKENRAYGDNTTELITEIQRPRILAIYFKSGRNYKLVTQNNNFLLRSEEGGAMGDPLRPLSISNNKLSLAFEGGGSWRWKLNYSFKYQNRDWYLENANHYTYNDQSGEMTDKRYDFLNKKKVTITGKISNLPAGNESAEQNFPIKALRTFTSFKKPWTWEIADGEYL